jgi:hypothetical protein
MAVALVQKYPFRSFVFGDNPKQSYLPFVLCSSDAVMKIIKVLFDIKMLICTVGESKLRWCGYFSRGLMKPSLEQNSLGKILYILLYSSELNHDKYSNGVCKTELHSSDRIPMKKLLLHKASIFMERLISMLEWVVAYFWLLAVKYLYI